MQSIDNKHLLEGYWPNHSTQDSINIMKHYARQDSSNQRIRDLADRIVSGIHPSDKKSQMMAVLNWILSNLEYVFDEHEGKRLFNVKEDVELVKSPIAVLDSKRYDCDCIATFIVSIFLYLGIPARFVTVGFSPVEVTGPDNEQTSGMEHVYAVGYDNGVSCGGNHGGNHGGKWIVVDPVSHPNEKQMILDTKQYQVYDIS